MAEENPQRSWIKRAETAEKQTTKGRQAGLDSCLSIGFSLPLSAGWYIDVQHGGKKKKSGRRHHPVSQAKVVRWVIIPMLGFQALSA